MGSGRSSLWMTAAGVGLLAVAVLTAPASSQEQPGTAEPREERAPRKEERAARKAARIRPVDLVVNSAKKLTWSPKDLERLAGTSGIKWMPARKEKPHPAIPIWDLLKDGGVERDTVAELRIAAASKVLTFKGDDLAKIDQLVLRNAAAGFVRPWRLAPMDPALEEKRGALSLVGIQRIEVITAR